MNDPHPPSTEPASNDLMRLFDWVTARDPVRAARLLADYLDDLAEETREGLAAAQDAC